MEFENREPRNERPQENSSFARNILIVLALLIVVVLAWNFFNEGTSEATETTELDTVTQPDTTQATTPVQTNQEQTVDVSTPAVAEKTTSTAETKPLPAKSINVTTMKGETRSHTVGVGETFLGIANRFNLKQSTLQALNPDVNPNAVKAGVTKLKVKVQGVHTVGPGDILRVVAKKYGVTVEQLMSINKKKKNFTERGEELIIPVSERQ